ncbi:CHRD domain-containing protein [Natronomonas gomsonensis]|uniref:CHRD domain-containing protein n=1 Tax=Natronomonas gomsonensis TaxID=1046043 RepID=UPI0015B9F795|nr:CHRD domain-containing protein [Natronomonas gomsonensis]
MGGLAASASLGALGSEASSQAQAQTDDEPEEWPPVDIWEAHVAVLSGNQADVETDASGCTHMMPGEEGTLVVDLVLEDIECVTQAHIHEGGRGEDGPVVAPLLGYTEEVDGSGDGDPLTTPRDVPLIEGTVVDDPELVEAILDDPEAYYVNVHTVHNPGGEIRGQIRGFDFGQETELEPVPAEFTVSGLDPDDIEVVRGEQIDVSARIRNVGDITDIQTVELRIDDEVVAERELELACRSSRRIRFEDIDTDGFDPDEYEYGTFTEGDSETGTLTVLRPAEFRVSDLNPEDVTVTQGDLIDVSATIENVGDVSDTQTVEFRVDDEPVAEGRLELDGGESRRIAFEEIDTSELDPDEYEHGIFTEDDSETATLTVLSPPNFMVSELEPMDVTVTRGDQIDVSATIENVGEAAGTQTVEFRIGGETIDDQALELDGGASEAVGFDAVDTSGLEPSEYEHGVFTDDDSVTGTLTVEAVQEAQFVVAELEPEVQTVAQGEQFGLTARIENVGEVAGTQTVELSLAEEIISEREVELESGESAMLDYEEIETVGLDPGEYEYVVSTGDTSATGTLTVEAVDGDGEEENGEDGEDDGGEETPTEDTPTQDTPTEDTPTQDTPTEEDGDGGDT